MIRWDDLRWHQPFRWLPTLDELRTTWADLVAVWVHHYCNHCPARPDHTGGGYSFWRCARFRGHAGVHRSRNYVWDDRGQTSYSPWPLDAGPSPYQVARQDFGGGRGWWYRVQADRWDAKRKRALARGREQVRGGE